MIIRNGTVFLPEEGFVKKDVEFIDDKITRVEDQITDSQEEEFDATVCDARAH